MRNNFVGFENKSFLQLIFSKFTNKNCLIFLIFKVKETPLFDRIIDTNKYILFGTCQPILKKCENELAFVFE